MDNLTSEQRKKSMSSIGSKDTLIEVALRKELWSRGLHYRKNCKNFPGKLDIIFIGKKVAVFCDSEFWHGYDWENQKTHIQTNQDYWISKIERNIEHDQEVNDKLRTMGFIVIRFWGNEIKDDVKKCADQVELIIRSSN